jgi:DNA-directed RNA polymerase specialized sigma24 family protein
MNRSVEPRQITDLDLALAAFLNQSSAFNDFDVLARQHLERYSRRFGGGLPADIREEIVDETIAGLMQSSPRAFDPARGSALTFLAYETRHAARRVRATYTAPGQKTRVKKVDRSDERMPKSVSALEAACAFERAETSGYGVARHVEIAVEVFDILSLATTRVGRALVAGYFDGQSLRQIANQLGVNHGTLSREINAFFDAQRIAA